MYSVCLQLLMTIFIFSLKKMRWEKKRWMSVKNRTIWKANPKHRVNAKTKSWLSPKDQMGKSRKYWSHENTLVKYNDLILNILLEPIIITANKSNFWTKTEILSPLVWVNKALLLWGEMFKYYINIINIPVSVLMPGISGSIQHDLKYYMNIFWNDK